MQRLDHFLLLQSFVPAAYDLLSRLATGQFQTTKSARARRSLQQVYPAESLSGAAVADLTLSRLQTSTSDHKSMGHDVEEGRKPLQLPGTTELPAKSKPGKTPERAARGDWLLAFFRLINIITICCAALCKQNPLLSPVQIAPSLVAFHSISLLECRYGCRLHGLGGKRQARGDPCVYPTCHHLTEAVCACN